jgi:hypothetical protein
MWLKEGRKETVMVAFLFVSVLAILGFLCLAGPDGVIGPRHRH